MDCEGNGWMKLSTQSPMPAGCWDGAIIVYFEATGCCGFYTELSGFASAIVDYSCSFIGRLKHTTGEL